MLNDFPVGKKFKMGTIFVRVESIEGNVLVLVTPAGCVQCCGIRIASALLSEILERDRIDLVAEEQYVRDNGGTPYLVDSNIRVDKRD